VIDPRTLDDGTAPLELQRHRFEAMATDVEFLLDAEPSAESLEALRAAETEIHRLEALLSRFRPDSELSQLNRRGSLVVGPDLLAAVELALGGRRLTRGRFDPTVHDAVVAAGYDCSFDSLPLDRAEPVSPSLALCGGGVTVDAERSLIRLDPGVHLDLGGIGKGYAVDRVSEILSGVGPCLVSLGGDLAVRGGLDGGPWPIGVDTPTGTITLGLEDGAVATSGRDRRRWRVNGEERHHLIDPSTGQPADTDLLRATAVAVTAVDAELMAKMLFLAGAEAAAREADELDIPCVLVTGDGRAILAGGLS
jgi:FAD:protein FMN transferase